MRALLQAEVAPKRGETALLSEARVASQRPKTPTGLLGAAIRAQKGNPRRSGA